MHTVKTGQGKNVGIIFNASKNQTAIMTKREEQQGRSKYTKNSDEIST